MKKIVLILVVLSLFSCGNDVKKKYRSDGSLEFEGEYKNGRYNGFGKWYYPNGKIRLEGNYVNDKEEGLFRYYYETGELEMETIFESGKKNGEGKQYFMTGEIEAITNYKNGIKNGDITFFYKNGKIKMEAYYENDSSVTYYIKYDSLGLITDESRSFDVIHKDTIYLGEPFEIDIILGEPIEDTVFVTTNIHYYNEPSKSSNPFKFNLKDNKYHLTMTPNIAGKWGYLGQYYIGKGKNMRAYMIDLMEFYVIDREIKL